MVIKDYCTVCTFTRIWPILRAMRDCESSIDTGHTVPVVLVKDYCTRIWPILMAMCYCKSEMRRTEKRTSISHPRPGYEFWFDTWHSTHSKGYGTVRTRKYPARLLPTRLSTFLFHTKTGNFLVLGLLLNERLSSPGARLPHNEKEREDYAHSHCLFQRASKILLNFRDSGWNAYT
jgi:hypothetical protein